MKLGTKMFFCITIFFSAAFLIGGYLLITFFYDITMEREIEAASNIEFPPSVLLYFSPSHVKICIPFKSLLKTDNHEMLSVAGKVG